MFGNKQFARHAMLFMVLGVFFMFFYSGLQNDHLNVLAPYLKDKYGWDDLKITGPVTVSALVTIALYFFVGAAFVKFGVKVILVPCMVVLALGCLGIALCGDNYILYSVSIFLIRALVVPMQLGAFMICANWFIKYRGRVMGVITAGSPLFSIFGLAAMASLVNAIELYAYGIVAGIVIALALVTALFMKDTPEQFGLNPDGVDHHPYSEEKDAGEKITLKQLLSEWRAWQLIVSYGIMQFVIVAMMAYMAIRYISLSGPDNVPNLFVSDAMKWLALGAGSGIPMSYVLGWVDDKLGSIKASLLLNLLFFFAVIPLALMPVGGNTVLMAIWAFGVACMVGGVPTMHPCIVSYVYGRKHYMEANKWIMTIQAIPMAFALTFMGAFNQAGQLTLAYYVLIAMLVVSFIIILTMRNLRDANEEDRDYVRS